MQLKLGCCFKGEQQMEYFPPLCFVRTSLQTLDSRSHRPLQLKESNNEKDPFGIAVNSHAWLALGNGFVGAINDSGCI